MLSRAPVSLVSITAPASWEVWCFGFAPYGWGGKDEEI